MISKTRHVCSHDSALSSAFNESKSHLACPRIDRHGFGLWMASFLVNRERDHRDGKLLCIATVFGFERRARHYKNATAVPEESDTDNVCFGILFRFYMYFFHVLIVVDSFPAQENIQPVLLDKYAHEIVEADFQAHPGVSHLDSGVALFIFGRKLLCERDQLGGVLLQSFGGYGRRCIPLNVRINQYIEGQIFAVEGTVSKIEIGLVDFLLAGQFVGEKNRYSVHAL